MNILCMVREAATGWNTHTCTRVHTQAYNIRVYTFCSSNAACGATSHCADQAGASGVGRRGTVSWLVDVVVVVWCVCLVDGNEYTHHHNGRPNLTDLSSNARNDGGSSDSGPSSPPSPSPPPRLPQPLQSSAHAAKATPAGSHAKGESGGGMRGSVAVASAAALVAAAGGWSSSLSLDFGVRWRACTSSCRRG